MSCSCEKGGTNSYTRMDYPQVHTKTKDCDDYPIKSLDTADLPVWGDSVLPPNGYLLMSSVQKDTRCGDEVPYYFHLPIASLTPGSTVQGNTYKANGNGATIVVPEQQVKAGYTYNNAPNDIRYAENHEDEFVKAQYIILAQSDNGSYIIQGSGFYTFAGGHKYIVGYTYYLGENGDPTTDSTFYNGVRQKLFEVIDQRTILINIETERE